MTDQKESMALELVKPTPDMERAYRDFTGEWEQDDEEIIPYAARPQGKEYAQWLEDTIAMETNAPDGLVTASTYFLMDGQNEILGAVNIRHHLNKGLLKHGGHIGYGIRPSQRRQGYAVRMLALALPIAKGLGIDRALITCDKRNIASARTILTNGGVLENEVEEEGGQITQRYWIDL